MREDETSTGPFDVVAYRQAVPDVVAYLRSGSLGDSFPPGWSDMHAVWSRAGDPKGIVERALELAQSPPSAPAATAGGVDHQLEIFLLQQVDLAWWGRVPDIATADDLLRADGLERLGREDGSGLRYWPASDAWAPRVRNLLVRRFAPGRRPADAGLSFPVAQAGVLGMLRMVAEEFARRGGGPLWVTSMTRPVEHQRHLQALGFTAFLPSAHCRGWAADIEAGWYDHAGTRGVLADVVVGFMDAGLLNAIDEGRIWHLCPNPSWVARVVGSGTERD